MKDQNTSEEIDLISVYTSIKNGFLNLMRSISYLFSFSIKNIVPLLLFIIVGAGISIGMFYLKRPVYVAELTVSHIRLNNSECYAYMNNLTKNNVYDPAILAEKLGIGIEIAKHIKSISCKALNESLEKNYKDSAFVLFPFKIEVSSYSNSIFDSLQKGLLNYLESNKFATKRKIINREYLDKYDERLKGEIIAIDSLKLIVDKSILPRNNGNGIILGEPIDPVKVYQTGMDLYQTQLRIEEQRELNNSFEIMVDFPKRAFEVSNLFIYIITSVILSYLIGLIWLFRRVKNKQ